MLPMKHRMGLSGWTHSGMVLLALLALLVECAAVGPSGSTTVKNNSSQRLCATISKT